MEAPKPPSWHYRKADELLQRAEEITTAFSEVPPEAFKRQAELATLHGMITDRAIAHAELAQAPHDEWIEAYEEFDREAIPAESSV
jgi:hypothetical protein